MLPERSKRYVSPDGEIPRLVLTRPWQLALIALLVLTLLVMIFPHRALVESLYQQERLDELTLSYIQNLYRTEPDNADVALLLARTQVDALRQPRLIETLQHLLAAGSARQRREARQLLLKAYTQTVAGSAAEHASQRAQLIALLEQARGDTLSTGEAQLLAQRAFDLNLPNLGLEFFNRLSLSEADLAPERVGDLALGQGHHALAAMYFMQARERASDRTQARRLFQKSLQTYMQASLFDAAMQAAQQHLGDLANDLPTLRYLARASRAAGKPVLAADYARRLVFLDASERKP